MTQKAPTLFRTFTLGDTEGIHHVLSQTEWHLLRNLEFFALVKQAVEVHMNTVTIGGIKQNVLAMTVTETASASQR